MSKIKALIFDFGDVFINLDKEGAMKNALNLFELDQFPEELFAINALYEQGLMSTNEFLDFYKDNFPRLTKDQIIDAWNYILKDFPMHRLDFIKELAQKNNYKRILLSNTNELHIQWIMDRISFYEEFKNCFDAFYLSHEIGMRKPNDDIYNFVLEQHSLNAASCLFIDDTKENTDTANALGIHTWNIDETSEDIVDLFNINTHLF
ncbi:HAD family phosphatase [Psychroserpens sp.]|uniref:HAD family hydrolase n=1 Tax=Psychroserpens sp. TaxID=2020870 RepID=UPI001B1C3D9C|nr:HAD family phosphatase [Psychroserpens sp.]MBO6606816.1 HAD family phosphatase [Psychroserpens sp.]MBO6631139.1 HAD family phosphatase [Psychroserpens sp.]MBO6653519.1 HAD family phosphatase [Psychroserpens sp.]MBO6680453.1 HAD family phosphatase [Psychroserpens sp.]MBO6750588.1 HAD family phosphatase [Psychroserpens sp.]